MAETSARLLRLLDLLQQRPDWTGTELAERLEVTTRTVRKDVSRLRALGYPVDANPGVAGGYRLAAGAHVPPLLLDDDEAVAIAIGLRTAAYAGIVGIEETSLRALAKLEQMLPSHLRRRVGALQAAIEPLRWTSQNALVEPESLAVLSQACRDREQVRFDYADKAGTETRRLVEPEKLVLVGHRWYLAAWDTRREDWRTFRLDRLTRPRLAGVRTRARPLPDGAVDAAEYVSRSISATDRLIEASVLLHVPLDQARTAVPGHVGTLEPVDRSTTRLRVEVENLEWLALRLGLIDLDFTVESPDELRDVVGRVGARLAAGAGRELRPGRR
ncbi:MAG: helix-turn-helix transcriptional regulator [Acidimicrobiales bacterium]